MENRNKGKYNNNNKGKGKGDYSRRDGRAENRREQTEQVDTEGLVVGRNAVRELLKSGRTVDKILVQRGEREGSIVVLVAEAIERKIPVIETDKAKLDKISNFAAHQGVIAMAAEK